MGTPIQKKSGVTSEEEVKWNSIEVIYFIILLALPFTFAAITLLVLAIFGPVQSSHSVPMNTLGIHWP